MPRSLGRTLFLRRHMSEVAAVAAVVASTAVGATLVLQLWDADLYVPFLYSQDANLHLMMVKGMLDNGWWLENQHLAAPLGQELYDFPLLSGDHLNVVLIKAFTVITGDAAAAVNLFFLATFPLVAISAYTVFRWLGVGRYPAVAASTLYALLPYHFLRGEGHLLLSAYYAVPLGCFLVLRVFRGEDLFTQDREARSFMRRYATKQTLTTLALCLVIATASGSFYYSGFTLVLLLLSAPLAALATKRARVLAMAAGVGAAILLFSVVQATPSLWYRHIHGTNPDIGQRGPSESEFYSLKLTQLVLPLQYHRIDYVARQRQRYDEWNPNATEADVATLGTFGTLGFFGSLAALIIASARLPARRPNALIVASGAVMLLAFLTATRGGFSSIIAMAYAQLRAWNRLSIFIAFLSLLAVAIALEWIGNWLRDRGAGRILITLLLLAFMTLGVVEQTTTGFFVPYRATRDAYSRDAAFVSKIEDEVPPGASIFQLPYATFPESTTPPPGRQLVYDSVRPYLHSTTLEWSFGALRSRPSDWASKLADRPVPDVVRAVAAVGFAGLYLDRAGYDEDAEAAATTTALMRLLEVEPLRSDDGRFVFFPLANYRARLEESWSRSRMRRLCAQTLGVRDDVYCRR